MARWILAGLLIAGCRAGVDEPGYAVTPGMFDSVPFDPYDRNPNTPAGRTLMHPPDGTVPMGTLPFPYGAGKEEAKRAGIELSNPVAASPEALSRGKWAYETFCLVCHGARGEGDGSVIGAGRFPNPPSLLADRAKTLPDGTLFHIFTRGQGLMPSYAVQMLPDDRWKTILYVRSLQSPPEPPGGAP